MNAGITHSAQHSNLNDSVLAIETKMGVDGSTDPNSLDYKINHSSGGVPTSRHISTTLPLTGGGTLANDLTLSVNAYAGAGQGNGVIPDPGLMATGLIFTHAGWTSVGALTIAESQVLNLTSDLASKAGLASPTFTGTVTATTFSGALSGNATTSSDGISVIISSAPLSLSMSSKTVTGSITQASTSTSGYLSSGDWNTFNGKGSGSVTSVALGLPATAAIVEEQVQQPSDDADDDGAPEGRPEAGDVEGQLQLAGHPAAQPKQQAVHDQPDQAESEHVEQAADRLDDGLEHGVHHTDDQRQDLRHGAARGQFDAGHYGRGDAERGRGDEHAKQKLHPVILPHPNRRYPVVSGRPGPAARQDGRHAAAGHVESLDTGRVTCDDPSLGWASRARAEVGLRGGGSERDGSCLGIRRRRCCRAVRTRPAMGKSGRAGTPAPAPHPLSPERSGRRRPHYRPSRNASGRRPAGPSARGGQATHLAQPSMNLG